MSKEFVRRLPQDEPVEEAIHEAAYGCAHDGERAEDDGDAGSENGARVGTQPVPHSQTDMPESWAEGVVRKAEAWRKEKEARAEREQGWR